MQFRNKKESQRVLKIVITLESVVVDVENGRRKSIQYSLQKYGRANVKDVYVSRLELILLSTSIQKHRKYTPNNKVNDV